MRMIRSGPVPCKGCANPAQPEPPYTHRCPVAVRLARYARGGFVPSPSPHSRPLAPPGRHRWKLVAVLVVVGLLLAPAPLLAHAELVTSDPLPNSSLVDGPPSVGMIFSEPIDPDSALIELLDSQLRAVDGVGEPMVADGGVRAEVALPPLEPGIYTVSYQVVSTVDGHATEGLFAFVVDPTGAEAPPSIAPTSSSPSVDAWAVGARWLALLAALIGLGSLITWWHSGRSTLAALAPSADRRPPWGLVVGGGLVTALGLAAYLGLSARPIAEPSGLSLDPAAAFGWTPFAIAMRVAMLGGVASAGIGMVSLVIGWRGTA